MDETCDLRAHRQFWHSAWPAMLDIRGGHPMRIALIEDHDRLATSIVDGLAGFGFGVDAFVTAADGINATRTIVYDGIVLDLGLPDRDGVDVLRELRDRDGGTPVLILTARDGIDDRVAGLDAGADDYVLKPFAMKELAARLRALLRRPGRALGAVLKVGKLRLDVASRQASVNGTDIRFSSARGRRTGTANAARRSGYFKGRTRGRSLRPEHRCQRQCHRGSDLARAPSAGDGRCRLLDLHSLRHRLSAEGMRRP